ncbi:MAG: hypothetical protein WC568_08240 [Candidatus Methanoperedens sp.]
MLRQACVKPEMKRHDAGGYTMNFVNARQEQAAQGKVRGVYLGLCPVADVFAEAEGVVGRVAPDKDGIGVLFPFDKEKVVALANAELHGLARKLLEK